METLVQYEATVDHSSDLAVECACGEFVTRRCNWQRWARARRRSEARDELVYFAVSCRPSHDFPASII
jgi:hypothetical protein